MALRDGEYAQTGLTQPDQPDDLLIASTRMRPAARQPQIGVKVFMLFHRTPILAARRVPPVGAANR